MSNISIETKEAPGGLVARIIGDAGVAAVGELERQLMKLTAARPALVVVDLSGLAFISSLGMGSLVTFHKALHRQGGAVRFAAAQPVVMEAFKRARLDSVLSVYTTVREALA